MKKALAILTTWALAVGGLVAATTSSGSAQGAFDPGNNFSGYATGTDVFANALKNLQPGVELANANVGFSGAAANSTGLLSQYVPAGVAPNSPELKGPFENEMGNAVVPPDLESYKVNNVGVSTAGDNSYGRGSGLEVGLGTALPNNPDINQIIVTGLAEQMAAAGDIRTPGGNTAPDNSLRKSIDIPADPLLFAALLTGEAVGHYDAACSGKLPIDPGAVAGTGTGLTDTSNDLGWGNGQAAQVELLNTDSTPLAKPLGDPLSKPLIATTAGDPTNGAVVSARSFVHLDGPVNGSGIPIGPMSLVSEVHERILPVTLFKGTPNQVTIEVIGEAVLKAIATGSGATTKIAYSPPGLIRVTQLGQPPQEFPFPAPGGQIPPIQIVIPGTPPNLLEIELGEGPRAPDQAIAGNSNQMNPAGPIVSSANGQTLAWGALDLVRVRVLVPTAGADLLEARVGHMEVQAAVPTGGVTCPSVVAPTTPTTASGTTSPTAAPGTPSTQPGGTTTTTSGTVGPTTTTTAPSGTVGPTTTTTGNAGTVGGPQGPVVTPTPAAAVTPTTTPAQVLATTFSQSPTAAAQSQQPNFTG